MEPVKKIEKDIDESVYGTAYAAFGKGQEGKEACHAIAALCQVCSIDSLISNFILPLQEAIGNTVNGTKMEKASKMISDIVCAHNMICYYNIQACDNAAFKCNGKEVVTTYY